MVAKKPAEKAPAKRKPAKKPVDISAEFGEITVADLKRAAAELRKKKHVEPVEWVVPIAETTTVIPRKAYAKNAAFGLAMLTAGVAGGWWSAGGIQINSNPAPSDIVSESFDEYETLWRAAQVAAADKLDSGEFTKSQQVTEYRSLADGAALKQTRQPMLDAEFAEFGGDKWTAEKQAKFLRRYAQ